MPQYLINLLKQSRASRFSPVIQLGYSFLVYINLLIEKLLDRMLIKPHSCNELNDITAVIKTFERPARLKQLLRSIRYLYPSLKIIVVDDSKNPCYVEGVKRIVLPFDSGVSAGRNAGLAAVKTEFMLLLDDDFVFNRHTNIVQAYNDIKRNPTIDILAGDVVYLPLRLVHDYSDSSLFPTRSKPIFEAGTLIGGFPVLNKVPNFYIGRTKQIAKVAWDDRLKRIDHADFFTRALGVLTSVQDKSFKILHHPTYFDKTYMSFKNENRLDQLIIQQKYYENQNPEINKE